MRRTEIATNKTTIIPKSKPMRRLAADVSYIVLKRVILDLTS